MKISTLRGFRDRATGMLLGKEPVLVTRRGRLAGIYFPCPDETLPNDMRRHLFLRLSRVVEAEMKKRGVTEADLIDDFERYRKGRRETRRRR